MPNGARSSARRWALRVLGVPALVVASFGAAHAQESPKGSSFFNWMDNSVTVLPYGWEFRVDPSQQSTLTLEHAHDSKIGDMFAFIDFTKFNNAPSGADTWTWYGEISPRLSAGKIFDKDFSFTAFPFSTFAVKDVLLAATYERGRNADVAQAILVGIGFDLDAREAGILGRLGKFKFIQLNLYARAELTEGTPRGFRDMQMTVSAGYPFDIGRAKFLIDGYFDWVTGIGSEQWSYHLNPQFKLDIGNFWGKPDRLYAGVELDFWWNKYQIPDTPNFDTNQQAVSLLLKAHF